jgi:hypothetical protein
MSKIRHGLGVAAATAVATLIPVGVAGAVQNPTTGQPGTTGGFNCATNTAPVEPGNAANAPGSAFNETTPGRAGTVYAGNGDGIDATRREHGRGVAVRHCVSSSEFTLIAHTRPPSPWPELRTPGSRRAAPARFLAFGSTGMKPRRRRWRVVARGACRSVRTRALRPAGFHASPRSVAGDAATSTSALSSGSSDSRDVHGYAATSQGASTLSRPVFRRTESGFQDVDRLTSRQSLIRTRGPVASCPASRRGPLWRRRPSPAGRRRRCDRTGDPSGELCDTLSTWPTSRVRSSSMWLPSPP